MAGARATLVSLRWERIQVVVRLAPASPGSLSPSALRLQRSDDPAIGMPATRAWSSDGDILARFNVMQGPAGVPLESGRWILATDVVGPPDGLELAMPAATPEQPAATPELPAASFDTERGRYEVRPSIAGGALQLEVRLDPSGIGDAKARASRPLPIRIARAGAVAGFALLCRLARLAFRRDPRRVLFLGHYGTELSGDMQAVLARMTERGIDRERPVRTVAPMRTRGIGAWLRLPRELARAGTVVIEEDVLYMIWPIEARVIQLWHASGAIKTIGFSRIGKPFARSPWGRSYRYFTYAIVSGEHDVPLFAEAFGMPEVRVLPLGHPRIDRFFDATWRARARKATLEAFPMARGRRVILFAPTWRQSGASRIYDLSVLDYAGLYELCVEIDAVFIIRLHPTVTHPVDIPAEFGDRIVNGTTTVMDAPELLCATDLLITDYSSIILEFCLLGGPMLFFAPDLDEYRADRDVYMPYEEFVPGRIVQTFHALVDAIRREDYQVEKVQPFAASQFTHQDGGATDRVIELIIAADDR